MVREVPGVGIEPTRPGVRPQDFKSCASTSSATRAACFRPYGGGSKKNEPPNKKPPGTAGGKKMSGKRDSNPRPQPWQGCALPLSYSRVSGANIIAQAGILQTSAFTLTAFSCYLCLYDQSNSPGASP
jgi:hypothetical protein